MVEIFPNVDKKRPNFQRVFFDRLLVLLLIVVDLCALFLPKV